MTSIGGPSAQSTHGRGCAARSRRDRARLQTLRRPTSSPLRFRPHRSLRPESSDIDFLVDFAAGNVNLFNDYFDLKFELERITGRPVDLVDSSAIRNPFFKSSAFESARELYPA